MASRTVTLSDGREITFDSSRIKLRDVRELSDVTKTLGVIARMAGLTDEQLDDLSVDDAMLLAEGLNGVVSIPKAS